MTMQVRFERNSIVENSTLLSSSPIPRFPLNALISEVTRRHRAALPKQQKFVKSSITWDGLVCLRAMGTEMGTILERLFSPRLPYPGRSSPANIVLAHSNLGGLTLR